MFYQPDLLWSKSYILFKNEIIDLFSIAIALGMWPFLKLKPFIDYVLYF
ncbi:hypothetical protein BH23THE1_BH23THE1_20570 [soil metagenome]